MVVGLVVAAVGVALLVRLGPHSSYPVLLPAILAWGCGLGILTPAVVAAAIAAVDHDRAGLAAGVNNTARQAAGAAGIAAYGAVAGSPDDSTRFVAGMHVTGLATAALFLAVALASLVLIPRPTRE
jgi:DHA2 family methylenomycin A resistance protein-like MFS transporter